VCETSANKILSSLISKGYVVKTSFDGRRRFVKTALHFTTSQGCCLEQGSLALESNIINKSNNKTTRKEKEDNKLSSKKKFNFKQALMDLGVDENIVDDWIAVRKTKKATNTETALKRIATEINKSGISANECVTMAVERSWSGFKAEWANNLKPKPQQDFFKGFSKGKTDDRAKDYLRQLKVEIVFERDGVKYLKDDTFIQSEKRYYRNKFGALIEVPLGLVARPSEKWEYNKKTLTWVQDEQTMTLDDFMF
jgi:hypothetical protein